MYKKRQLALTLVTLGFFATACSSSPEIGMAESDMTADLTASEVTDLHSGQCITYWGPSNGIQCFDADGNTHYDDESYGMDTGQWEMRGDEMCVYWNNEPGWECGPIWRVDAETYTDGDYTWRLN